MSSNPPTDVTTHRYKRHRFSAVIIAHTVWLYLRFPPSLRHVEYLLAEHGIEVSFQTVAKWLPGSTENMPCAPEEVFPTNGISTKWSLLSRAGNTALLQEFALDGERLTSGYNYVESAPSCCLMEWAFAEANRPCCLHIMWMSSIPASMMLAAVSDLNPSTDRMRRLTRG